jgi:TIR domain
MTETKRPLKVFLCHAHADRDAVRTLYTRLTNDGVDAWLDKEKLLPGQDWELEIRKAVREADVVVVCLSKQFSQAGFRQKEVRLALDTAMEKPEGEIFIIPARLEECDNLESLRKWHWVDLFEENGYEMLMLALRTRANKIGATLQIKRNKEPKVEKKPVNYASQERVLEAAIEKQVSVGVPASLFVWIKRLESKSIISIVSSIDEDVVLNEDNVKSRGMEIEFPIENGRAVPIGISLKLVAHEFAPSIQQKKIIVPPTGDSEVCTFIVTPNKPGRLLLNLEVLKDQISIATRSLHTTATETKKKEPSSMVLASIPITILVQPKSKGVEVEGDISDSIVIKGNRNVINLDGGKTSPKPSEKKPDQGKNITIIVALIGLVGTISAALIGAYGNSNEPAPSPTPTIPIAITFTETLEPTLVPTDMSVTVEPTFTPISMTDTPVPTVTPSPIPIGQDWLAGCISTLWKPYPSNIPTAERGDGCLQEPVHVFSAENGDLDFLAERDSGSAETYGLFAPLPESGIVTFTIRIRELTNVDLLMGVYAQPDVNSSGLLMIMLNGGVEENVFIQKDPSNYVTIQGTQKIQQGNGYSISFRFDNLSAKSIVNPAVFFTENLSLPGAQKWLFLGYKGLRGAYRIEGTFLNFEIKP